jgi:hypothetical protein
MGLLYRIYRNINPLNIMLFLTIIVLAIFVIYPMFFVKMKYTLPAGKPKTGLLQEIPSGDIQAPPLQDYAVIGENNLFHPERKLVKEVAPLPKPELILYGTIIDDGISTAFIADKKSPKTTQGRGKRQTAVKKGDVLSGFVLKEIETDKIVLTRGEETIVVNLVDSGKQREGETTLPSANNSDTAMPIPFQRAPVVIPGHSIPSVSGSSPTAVIPKQTEQPKNSPVYTPQSRSYLRQQKYLSR